MNAINIDHLFEPILTQIKQGEIKTAHQLRLVLESLSEKFNIKALTILVMFREWLAEKNIDLSTENGMVTISKLEKK